MRAAVLGCGPAGLAAAWATLMNTNYDIVIVSKKWEPSIQYGCQYLHAPIPGFENVSNVTVGYSLRGTPEQYRRKVYGDAWEGKVSPEDFVGRHQAWDIRETYRLMWELFDSTANLSDSRVSTAEIDVKRGDLRAVDNLEVDKIISTIPANSLCRDFSHEFVRHIIYANGDVEQSKMFDNFVLCDGTAEMDWYRVANVFGYRTVEWPSSPDKQIPDAIRVTKPLSTNCNCHGDVIRVGRYGEWSKGVLVHEVYNKVLEALK